VISPRLGSGPGLLETRGGGGFVRVPPLALVPDFLERKLKRPMVGSELPVRDGEQPPESAAGLEPELRPGGRSSQGRGGGCRKRNRSVAQGPLGVVKSSIREAFSRIE